MDNYIDKMLKEIVELISKKYIDSMSKKEKERRTHGQLADEDIRNAMKTIDPIIDKAVAGIAVSGPDGKHQPTLDQKVKLLLMKQFLNRPEMENEQMFTVLSFVLGMDVSYEAVKKFYSDKRVVNALQNLYRLLLKDVKR